jgi:hypothetical protein
VSTSSPRSRGQDWRNVFNGDVWRARILQAELEGEGVPTHVVEPQINVDNLYDNNGLTYGGASVFVPARYLEEALRILAREG